MVSINKCLELLTGVELKNRLVKASTTEGLADSFGNVTEELINLYKTLATESNVGLILSGNVLVDRRYLERPGNVVIDADYGELSDEQKEMFRKLAKAGQTDGTKFMIQIGHAGRQSTGLVCKESVAPSNIASQAVGTGLVNCKEASKEYLMRVKEKMIYAAAVLEECGFDGIQLHSAHGYLLSSFLSPLANKRTDEFGGSLENRARLLLDTVSAVVEQRKSDSFLIGVKLNSSDFQKGGLTAKEAAEVSKWLAARGVDLLELSGGNYESPALMTGDTGNETSIKQESTMKREAFFLDFAEEITSLLKEEKLDSMKVIVTGGFRTKQAMGDALTKGACDLIGLGRPICMDPKCTKRLLEGDISELPRAEKYWKLPSLFAWNFFQKIKTVYTIQMGATNFLLQDNLIDIGKGTYKTQTNEEYPNLLRVFFSHLQNEKAKAKALDGYKPDPCLQSYIKTTKN